MWDATRYASTERSGGIDPIHVQDPAGAECFAFPAVHNVTRNPGAVRQRRGGPMRKAQTLESGGTPGNVPFPSGAMPLTL